ncbi:hypothetical protein ON010_g5558 [Phytophthora cinnamomi]|nr:hypothetical protein ON010_g5558 [Phytophthora cinnamomi]
MSTPRSNRDTSFSREVSKGLSLPLPPKTVFKTPLPLNLLYKILAKTPNLVTTFTTLTNIHPCGLLAKQNLSTSERVAIVDSKRKNFTDADGALKSSVTSPTRADTPKKWRRGSTWQTP